MKKNKLIAKLKADSRVHDAWDEGEDGMWVMAKDGWSFDFYGDNSHTIHEWTTKDLRSQFKTMRPCACAECKPRLASLPVHQPQPEKI